MGNCEFTAKAKLELLMAGVVRLKIAEAMTAYRIDRSPRVLLINTGYALGATLILVLLLLALRRLFRWLEIVAERRFESRIEGLEAQSFHLLRARQVLTALHTILKTLSVVSVLVLVYVYLNFVLGLYPWSRPLAQYLFALFLHPLYTIGTAVLTTLPNLVFVAILVMLTRYVLRVTRFFFAGLDQGTITLANFDWDWAWTTYLTSRRITTPSKARSCTQRKRCRISMRRPSAPGSRRSRAACSVATARPRAIPSMWCSSAPAQFSSRPSRVRDGM
jgi:hypothetical protein